MENSRFIRRHTRGAFSFEQCVDDNTGVYSLTLYEHDKVCHITHTSSELKADELWWSGRSNCDDQALRGRW